MPNILRIFPLILLIGFVDFSCYILIVEPLVHSNDWWIKSIFWTIPFLAIGALYFYPRRSSRAIDEPIRRDIHSSILITYMAKFLGIIVFLLLSLIIGATSGLLNILSMASIDTYIPVSYTHLTLPTICSV